MPKKENFLEYIVYHSTDNSPIGDFCEDTLRLIRMGKRPSSYSLSGMVFFVKFNGGCEESIDACKEAWVDWKSVI